MQRHFQLSPPSVHQMVLTLERLGHIRRARPSAQREVLIAPEDLPVEALEGATIGNTAAAEACSLRAVGISYDQGGAPLASIVFSSPHLANSESEEARPVIDEASSHFGEEFVELREQRSENYEHPNGRLAKGGAIWMTTRRFAAILAADVVGFSTMMERHEEGTVARLRKLQRDCVRLANDGQDTLALQQYLGHKNIQRTVRYTEFAAIASNPSGRMRLRLVLAGCSLPSHRPLSSAFRLQASYP